MSNATSDPIRELARLLAERIVDDLLREEANPGRLTRARPPNSERQADPVDAQP